jgi:hypothetical protein
MSSPRLTVAIRTKSQVVISTHSSPSTLSPEDIAKPIVVKIACPTISQTVANPIHRWA